MTVVMSDTCCDVRCITPKRGLHFKISFKHTPSKSMSKDSEAKVMMVSQSGRPLEKILKYPTPVSKLPTLKQKQSSQV